MEMTMRKNIISVLVSLIVALTARVATAAEQHHTRTKARAVACEPLLKSNAYAARGDIAVESYWQNYAEGEMASGPAGH
jgi:hypothetical protein